jgi:PKD repeat protein
MANFVASQSSGIAPLSVTFWNTSITYGPTTWAWDLNGDGTTDSTAQSPSFTYPAPGTYSVTLTASDYLDTDTITGTVTVRAPQEGTYVALSPTRLLDTRSGNGLAGAFSAGIPRSFDVAGRGGVPDNAIAVTGNLTVTGQSAAGFLSLGPDPAPVPTNSTLNFPAGDSRANGVTVALGADGSLSVTYSAPAGAATHVVFDVTGYFVP